MCGLYLASNAVTLSVSPAYPKISAQIPLHLLVLPYGSASNLGGASMRRQHQGSTIEAVEYPGGDTGKKITWNM